MEETNIANRIKLVIEALGINDSQFADNCSISRSSLSLILSGKNKKISDVVIGQIHKTYPALSILWLLFDEGSMWVNKKEEDTIKIDNVITKNKKADLLNHEGNPEDPILKKKRFKP